MEKYFYKTDETGVNCIEDCNYSNVENIPGPVKIGSQACKMCENNIAYDGEESWVKCEVFSAFAEVIIKEEIIEELKCKVEQLENELASLKGGL